LRHYFHLQYSSRISFRMLSKCCASKPTSTSVLSTPLTCCSPESSNQGKVTSLSLIHYDFNLNQSHPRQLDSTSHLMVVSQYVDRKFSTSTIHRYGSCHIQVLRRVQETTMWLPPTCPTNSALASQTVIESEVRLP
jgi:hypothetical protein